jgi:hypothetical protein
MNEAAALGKAIKEAAGVSGAMLIEATVHSEGDSSGPSVVIGQADAIRLVTAIKPRVIYLVEQLFDLPDEISTVEEKLDGIGVDLPSVTLKSIERRFVGNDGQVALAIASFMIGGILHTAISTATWYDEFDAAIDVIMDAARDSAAANRSSERVAQNGEIRRKAMALSKHPSFNHGRVSFDKRMTLAEALFEGSDQTELSEITRLAENLFWLEQSGFVHRSP